MLAGRTFEPQPTAGDSGGDHEGPGLDPVGDDAVIGAPEALATFDLDGVRIGPLDRRAHRLEERDQVVHLGLLGGRPDDRGPLGQGRGQHRVLRAHHRHERETDLAAAEASRRGGEVVAVPVLDRGTERPHRLDVEVDGAAADPVAAGVADDDLPEPGQERTQEDEACAHPRCRLERNEQPFDVAGGYLVDVIGRVVDDDPEVTQRLGHDPHVLDLRDVREATAFAGQRRGGQQLERGVLRATDRDGPRQRPAALDPEDLLGDRLRPELPVERPRVSHGDRLYR